MYTVSDIIADINRGILANNLKEDRFLYRIVCFINSESGNKKYYIDTQYDGLRAALENIIRKNLTVTNTVVIAQATVRKNSESVLLLSKAYSFSLDGYFKQISGECKNGNRNGNIMYDRYAVK